MLLDFYQFREQPFGVTPDPKFLYLGRSHREALASLYCGVEEDRGFVTLIAPPGMGKTTLLHQLRARLQKNCSMAFLFQTQCNSRELLRYLLTDMKVDYHGEDFVEMHDRLNEALVRIRQTGSRFVLFIDEAQNLDDSVLETVRLLSDFETPRSKLMQIVLAGQPQLAEKLARPELLQLRQRVSIWARLEPLSPQEVNAYIDHRLSIAGCANQSLFSLDARRRIAAYSGGIPRNINALCFGALSMSCAAGKKRVEAKAVCEAAADLTPLTDTCVAPVSAPCHRVAPAPAATLRIQNAPPRNSALQLLVIAVAVILSATVWSFLANGRAVAPGEQGMSVLGADHRQSLSLGPHHDLVTAQSATEPNHSKPQTASPSRDATPPSTNITGLNTDAGETGGAERPTSLAQSKRHISHTAMDPIVDTQSESSTQVSGPFQILEYPRVRHAATSDAKNSGEILFLTKPPGLDVLIDESPYGRSPIRAVMPAGTHFFQVQPPQGAPGAFGKFELGASTVKIETVQWPDVLQSAQTSALEQGASVSSRKSP